MNPDRFALDQAIADYLNGAPNCQSDECPKNRRRREFLPASLSDDSNKNYSMTSQDDQSQFALAMWYLQPDPAKVAAIMDVSGTGLRKQKDFVDEWDLDNT